MYNRPITVSPKFLNSLSLCASFRLFQCLYPVLGTPISGAPPQSGSTMYYTDCFSASLPRTGDPHLGCPSTIRLYHVLYWLFQCLAPLYWGPPSLPPSPRSSSLMYYGDMSCQIVWLFQCLAPLYWGPPSRAPLHDQALLCIMVKPHQSTRRPPPPPPPSSHRHKASPAAVKPTTSCQTCLLSQ